jgi:uncharacterized protein YraI
MSLKKLTLAVPLAALGLFAVGSASAAMVTTELNIRAAPSDSAAIIGVLERGTRVQCTSTVGNWCELTGGEGYVFSAYLDFDDDDDDFDDDDDDDDFDDEEDDDDFDEDDDDDD